MKIVLKYTDSDGCTYSCDCVYPIVCESVEEAYCAFDDALAGTKHGLFTVFGLEFVTHKFADGYRPEFLTVDEWFAREAYHQV